MSAPVLPAEREIPSCGYFTGDTTPPGCQALMVKYRAAIRVTSAAHTLAMFVERSLNVGPLTKDPSREAALWRKLRSELDEFTRLARAQGIVTRRAETSEAQAPGASASERVEPGRDSDAPTLTHFPEKDNPDAV